MSAGVPKTGIIFISVVIFCLEYMFFIQAKMLVQQYAEFGHKLPFVYQVYKQLDFRR